MCCCVWRLFSRLLSTRKECASETRITFVVFSSSLPAWNWIGFNNRKTFHCTVHRLRHSWHLHRSADERDAVCGFCFSNIFFRRPFSRFHFIFVYLSINLNVAIYFAWNARFCCYSNGSDRWKLATSKKKFEIPRSQTKDGVGFKIATNVTVEKLHAEHWSAHTCKWCTLAWHSSDGSGSCATSWKSLSKPKQTEHILNASQTPNTKANFMLSHFEYSRHHLPNTISYRRMSLVRAAYFSILMLSSSYLFEMNWMQLRSQHDRRTWMNNSMDFFYSKCNQNRTQCNDCVRQSTRCIAKVECIHRMKWKLKYKKARQ